MSSRINKFLTLVLIALFAMLLVMKRKQPTNKASFLTTIKKALV